MENLEELFLRKIIVIFGAPRSGTTFIANQIKLENKDSEKVCILDEMNPFSLVKFNEDYFQHLRKRSQLVRKTSENENLDRFDLINNQFKEVNWDFAEVWKRILAEFDTVIIKYPRGLEDKELLLKLEVLWSSGVKIDLIPVQRPEQEVIASFERRNMYFFNNFIGKRYSYLVINRYKNLYTKLKEKDVYVHHFSSKKENSSVQKSNIDLFQKIKNIVEDTLPPTKMEKLLFRLVKKCREYRRRNYW